VKLKQAWTDGSEDLIDQRIVGIDQDRDRLDAARSWLGKLLRSLWLDMARALRKEHEADIVGAGINCRVHDLSRANAANFHLHRHLADFPWLGVQG
jgi:hypothetical protein